MRNNAKRHPRSEVERSTEARRKRADRETEGVGDFG